MSKLNVLNIKGEKVKDVTLNKEVFGIEPNDVVLYDAITLARNSQRQGTHSVKTRAEVAGGGKKPWKQKGTGRARQGSIRSPQWRGGGIIFGPQTDANHTKKQNRKERRLALKSALAYKALESELLVIENFDLKTNKTKEAKEVLNTLGATKNVLLVLNELTDNVIMATRNLGYVTLLEASEINVLDIVSSDVMVVTTDALNAIEEVLK